MDTLTEEQLAGALICWFDTADFNKRHFFLRNPVGSILKRELEQRGHWKKTSKRKGKTGGFTKANVPNKTASTSQQILGDFLAKNNRKF